ncbi:hypothetical protein BHM03_00049905 [Ensete ventricosum]|nr:hypothetical protein BHM03_00049905 [Ensete ventricosum]
MTKHHSESSKMGKPDPYLKQPLVGCKCKLTRKLLEPFMSSGVANKTSTKLDILHELRRCNLVRQLGKGATKRNLQRWKLALMFLKRAWRNSTKGNKDSLG